MSRGGVDNRRTHNSLPTDFATSNGCRYYSDCLSCPLPSCIHDEPLSLQLRKARDALIVRLWYLGKSSQRIGGILNINMRIVGKALRDEDKRRRDGEGEFAFEVYTRIDWSKVELDNTE